MGTVNSFLSGNGFVRRLMKKSRAKSEGSTTEYCDGEMPSSKPIPSVCVSIDTHCVNDTVQCVYCKDK